MFNLFLEFLLPLKPVIRYNRCLVGLGYRAAVLVLFVSALLSSGDTLLLFPSDRLVTATPNTLLSFYAFWLSLSPHPETSLGICALSVSLSLYTTTPHAHHPQETPRYTSRRKSLTAKYASPFATVLCTLIPCLAVLNAVLYSCIREALGADPLRLPMICPIFGPTLFVF